MNAHTLNPTKNSYSCRITWNMHTGTQKHTHTVNYVVGHLQSKHSMFQRMSITQWFLENTVRKLAHLYPSSQHFPIKTLHCMPTSPSILLFLCTQSTYFQALLSTAFLMVPLPLLECWLLPLRETSPPGLWWLWFSILLQVELEANWEKRGGGRCDDGRRREGRTESKRERDIFPLPLFMYTWTHWMSFFLKGPVLLVVNTFLRMEEEGLGLCSFPQGLT